jgi:two-component system sensor histidine kinase DesK
VTSPAAHGRYGSIIVVPTMSRWWRSRTDPQRIDLYTRSSFYSIAVGLPLVALLMVSSSAQAPAAGAALFLAGSVVTAAAGVLITRQALAGRVSGGVLDRRLLAAAAAAAVLTSIVAAWTFGSGTPDTDDAVVIWPVAIAPLVLLVLMSLVWDSHRLALASCVLAVAVGIGSALVEDFALVPTLLLIVVLAVSAVFMTLSFRFTVWLLDVVLEMERSRGVQLQLAVAEERLRFARDLHDVMGRNLSAIAVKSQLAGELVRRGRPGAADEVADISRIAEESLREVREVVRGYRSTDLTGELAGARSVLRAAGVACSVHGEDVGGALPEQAQTALAWVVREAVTNVLRHSRASTCSIELRRSDGEAELIVTNDGAGDTAPVWGNGLRGLSERLTGGTLTAGVREGSFRLSARVPA